MTLSGDPALDISKTVGWLVIVHCCEQWRRKTNTRQRNTSKLPVGYFVTVRIPTRWGKAQSSQLVLSHQIIVFNSLADIAIYSCPQLQFRSFAHWHTPATTMHTFLFKAASLAPIGCCSEKTFAMHHGELHCQLECVQLQYCNCVLDILVK